MKSFWCGRRLGDLRRRERGSEIGCSITITSGLTRGLGDYVLPIDFLRSRGVEKDDGARDRRQCFGDGTPGQTEGAVLHGGADGGPVSGVAGGEGKAAFDGG